MYLPAWQTGLFICAPFAPSQEFAQGGALFNMRFNTACALTYGQVLPPCLRPRSFWTRSWPGWPGGSTLPIAKGGPSSGAHGDLADRRPQPVP